MLRRLIPAQVNAPKNSKWWLATSTRSIITVHMTLCTLLTIYLNNKQYRAQSRPWTTDGSKTQQRERRIRYVDHTPIKQKHRCIQIEGLERETRQPIKTGLRIAGIKRLLKNMNSHGMHIHVNARGIYKMLNWTRR